MNRKLKIISICIILIVLALVAEVIIIKKSVKFEATVQIPIVSKDIDKFQFITEDMIEYREFKLTEVVSGSVRNKDEIVNKYARTKLFKDEQVNIERISDKKICFNKRPEASDNRYLTIAFTPEEANGWILDRNQIVDLVYLPKGFGVSSEIKVPRINTFYDLRIVSILDEDLNDVSDASEREKIPMYISFEVSNEDVDNIILAKNNGTVEVLVKH
ncbi:MAG: SAF domain-containing protein [Firmicutes bacterium]|jgi:hypothetical protein|nr:SAF domain-containing protein [Bacillota bacterium]